MQDPIQKLKVRESLKRGRNFGLPPDVKPGFQAKTTGGNKIGKIAFLVRKLLLHLPCVIPASNPTHQVPEQDIRYIQTDSHWKR